MKTPTKFTKEIKENWVANLESGKYKQGFVGLVVDENGFNINEDSVVEEKYFCCLGALGDCTEGLTNDTTFDNNPYVFLENTIGNQSMKKLYRLNDDREYRDSGKRDYSNVIPVIKSLPTVD